MMTRNLETLSRQPWDPGEKLIPTHKDLSLGCLQRIAAAAELMARNHDELVRERDYAVRRIGWMRDRVGRLERSNAALRGVITKMRKQVK